MIVTRYISVGSLCAYSILIEMILFGQWGWFDMEAGYCYELYGIAVLTALAWYLAMREHKASGQKEQKINSVQKERALIWQM